MRLNACVGKNGGPANFGRYSRGFFEAADRLVESLQQNERSVDLIVYPLVTNYRHGIETGLKHLMRILPSLCDEEKEPRLTHRLLDNWKFVRKYLAALEVETEELDRVERTLMDFIQIDPNGENFRYPEDRNGNRVLQDTSLINVEVLAEGMSFLGQFFEYCFDLAELLREAKREAMQEQRAWEREMADFYGLDFDFETADPGSFDHG